MRSSDQTRALNWDNFLLACTNCNSTKGNTEVILDQYVWPDRHNTFMVIQYSEGGLVTCAPNLPAALQKNVERTISLVGLDKTPNTQKASDRRWLNRKEAWEIAVRARERLRRIDISELRDQIVDTARAKGFWSIWMTVFRNDPDMLKRLLTSFPGTCTQCFDPADAYTPTPRSEPPTGKKVRKYEP